MRERRIRLDLVFDDWSIVDQSDDDVLSYREIVCTEGLAEWFDIPDDLCQIDLVIRDRPTAGSYDCFPMALRRDEMLEILIVANPLDRFAVPVYDQFHETLRQAFADGFSLHGWMHVSIEYDSAE